MYAKFIDGVVALRSRLFDPGAALAKSNFGVRFEEVVADSRPIFTNSVQDKADRLILASASYGKNIVAICDTDGKVLWSHKTAGPKTGHAGHHDIQFLDNGNILYHENWTTIVEMTLARKVVWSYDSGTQNGNKGKRVDVHAFRRLPNGLTMIAESGVGRIIEVDMDGKIHAEVKLKPGGTQNTRLARKLDNGNYLVCAENPGVVTEYNAKSEVVWEYPIKTRVFGADSACATATR